jgi:hypothetical protein
MTEKIKLLTGNINRKICKAKTGDTIKCSNLAEAVMLYTMAKRYGIDVSRRNAQVKFHSEIDRTKYEWVSGEPKKSNIKPSLGSVE